MRNLIGIGLVLLAVMSCSNEPKLNKAEENAVQNQLNHDQMAMDSLENAIKAQMEALDSVDAEADSIQ